MTRSAIMFIIGYSCALATPTKSSREAHPNREARLTIDSLLWLVRGEPARSARRLDAGARGTYLRSEFWNAASASSAAFSTLVLDDVTLLAAFSVVLAAASTRVPAFSTRVTLLRMVDER